MATIIDITNALYGVCTSVVSNVTGVSNADPHVDLYNRWNESTYPFVGVERNGPIPITRGIGGEVQHDGYLTDNSGSVTDNRKYRTRRLQCDVTPLDGNDDAAQADELYVALDDRFTQLDDEDGVSLHADVTDFMLSGIANDSRPQDGIRGRALTVEIEYRRYYTESIDAMENVDFDFEERPSGTKYSTSDTI